MLGEKLHQHVTRLAGTIGGRATHAYTGLLAAADYIERQFTDLGYQVES